MQNNLNFYFKSGLNFLKKYAGNYLLEMMIPVAMGFFGFLITYLIIRLGLAPEVLAAIIAIISICGAFWRGYVATYALNYAAFDYYKNGKENKLAEYVKKVNKKQLASYLSFCAIFTLIAYFPAFCYSFKTVNILDLFYNPFSVFGNISGFIKLFFAFLLNSVVILPFLNFFNQALFFKKENETYFNVVMKCFKLQNKQGICLSIIFGFLGGFISIFGLVPYLLLALLLNVLTFSINTFWYSDRC